MSKPKLLRCRDLAAVSRLVGRDSRYTFSMKRLRDTRTHEEHLLLSAPATLALAIDHSGISWPTDRPLRVLILGTNYLDLIDRGQWYRFVPAMLGIDGDIQIKAINCNSSSLRKSTVPNALINDQRISVQVDSRPARDYLPTSTSQFDIAICFSALAQGKPLLSDLIELAERGIPFYFTSFSGTHALLNHAILRAHRAKAEAVVGRNPFHIVSRRLGENRNLVLSRVPPQHLPFPGDKIDPDYYDALDITASVVLNSHRSGNPSQDWEVGSPVDGDWVHTLDGLAVNLTTFKVRDLTVKTDLGVLSNQWHEHVTAYDPECDEVDRLIWAAYIQYFAIADGILRTADKPAA
jgi:hypothetical protein